MERGIITLTTGLRQATEHEAASGTRFDPARYFKEKFGWEPWSGTDTEPGQQQVIDAYVLALRQQHEKQDYEAGILTLESLEYWYPGQVIQFVIRVEAGHTVGKTRLAAGLVSHYFDHFSPSIINTYAPSWNQIKRLLWKEIANDREGRSDLPGRVLDNCMIKYRSNHFAEGRATNNAGGRGTERIQGQHGPYLMLVMDEAEGVADYVYDAIESMTSGGICIVLLLANPRTRSSRFYQIRDGSDVRNFRISCLYHPNVIEGREVIPGAVKRDYVLKMVEKHCRVVSDHVEDNYTFELPWEPGVIYEPDTEMLFRVLGIPPSNVADKNLIPVGRYESAMKRAPIEMDPELARIGVDVARFGRDFGTVYIRWNGQVWCAGKLSNLDTIEYYHFIKKQALELKNKGVTSVHIRIDGGGGFGGGVVDNLKIDQELRDAFSDFRVYEHHFGGAPRDSKKFYDSITELTADVAETLKALAILNPPNELRADLCDREYGYKNKSGRQVMKLEEKLGFRKRIGRSPDDGDGFVLAVASDFLFRKKVLTAV